MKPIQPPIIIIGMHRSGTTMITQLLEIMGLFVGSSKDENCEAWFFLKLNDWLLRQCHGGWTHPEHIEHLLSHKQARDLTVDYLKHLLHGLPVAEYTGVYKFISGELPFQMSKPWGWKDPKNTFTLPIWLDIFPEAKIIHIYRNGVDVANSLWVRAEERELKPALELHSNRKKCFQYWFYKKKIGFSDSLRCLSLMEAFKLWEEHVAKAFEQLKLIPNERITIKYEEFLVKPEKFLIDMASFSGLDINPAKLAAAVAIVRSERGNAYKNRPELVRFYDEVKDNIWMKKLGYSVGSDCIRSGDKKNELS